MRLYCYEVRATECRGTTLILLIVGAIGMLFAEMTHSETLGERFDRYMAQWEKKYASMHLSPQETTCDILKLKPRNYRETKFVAVEGQPEPVPEEWVSTPEGRFAHSIKIPNPLPKDSGYRVGMTSQEYFIYLCKSESGEFIYRKAVNVDGLFQARTRELKTEYKIQHLYALEDPYGITFGDREEPETIFVKPNLYKFFESDAVSAIQPNWKRRFLDPSYFVPPNTQYKYARYEGYDGENPRSMVKRFDHTLRSRYAYIWRGIVRSHDRELGVAGGELILIDLKSGEVLGVKRGYVRAIEDDRRTGGMVWAEVCPIPTHNGKFANNFIPRVLEPASRIGPFGKEN